MAEPGPRPMRWRLIVLLALVAVVAGVAWILLPAPFSHGLIVGLLLGPLLLAGVVLLLVRVMRGRMDARMGKGLEPPPLPTAALARRTGLRSQRGIPSLAANR